VTLRRALVALAVAGLAAGAGACALDFDRFEPGDASAPPRADVSNEPIPGDASTDVTITGLEDAETADGGADEADAASTDVDALADGSQEAGPCTPSPSCLTSARTCGTSCTQQEQQCAMRCVGGGGCRSTCTRTENTCISQCESTCSSCTRSAGCSATADCADAASR
jgi:hypothetical protein